MPCKMERQLLDTCDMPITSKYKVQNTAEWQVAMASIINNIFRMKVDREAALMALRVGADRWERSKPYIYLYY